MYSKCTVRNFLFSARSNQTALLYSYFCLFFQPCNQFIGQVQISLGAFGVGVVASRSLQPRACLWAHTLPAIPQNPSVGCVRYARTHSFKNVFLNQTKGRLKVLSTFQTAFFIFISLFIFPTVQSVRQPSRDKPACLWRGRRRRGRGDRGWGLRRGGCCGG